MATMTPSGDLSASARRRTSHLRKKLAAWPYALPAFLAISATLIYPLVYALWLSFHRDRLSAEDGQFVGWANYQEIFARGQLAGTLGHTLVFTFGSMTASLIIGFAAALALEAFPRGSKVIRPILLMPWVIPGVAIAAIWLTILNPVTGLANDILGRFGVAPVGWLGSPGMAMTSLIIVNTWKGFPFAMLMLSAGLTTIPKEVLEAARIDGAGYYRILWSVILPLLKPVLSIILILGFIWTFNYFDLAYLLTDGGPSGGTTTIPYAIWQASIRFNRFDQGAAYSVLSVLITSVAIVFYLQVTRKKANE